MPGARAPPVIEETQRKVPVQLAVNDADALAVIKPTLAVIAGLGPVGTAGTNAVPLNGAAGLTSCMAIIWACDWLDVVYENKLSGSFPEDILYNTAEFNVELLCEYKVDQLAVNVVLATVWGLFTV
jgi:hypothetical protein